MNVKSLKIGGEFATWGVEHGSGINISSPHQDELVAHCHTCKPLPILLWWVAQYWWQHTPFIGPGVKHSERCSWSLLWKHIYPPLCNTHLHRCIEHQHFCFRILLLKWHLTESKMHCMEGLCLSLIQGAPDPSSDILGQNIGLGHMNCSGVVVSLTCWLQTSIPLKQKTAIGIRFDLSKAAQLLEGFIADLIKTRNTWNLQEAPINSGFHRVSNYFTCCRRTAISWCWQIRFHVEQARRMADKVARGTRAKISVSISSGRTWIEPAFSSGPLLCTLEAQFETLGSPSSSSSTCSLPLKPGFSCKVLDFPDLTFASIKFVVVARPPISCKKFPQILTNRCENPAPQKNQKEKKETRKKGEKYPNPIFSVAPLHPLPDGPTPSSELSDS